MIKWIDITESGARLDSYLAERLPELSRSAVQHLIEDGSITLNGCPLRKNAKTSSGDRICIQIPEPRVTDLSPQDIPLDVAYEDADVIIINKPRGMVVHPAPGHPDQTLVNALMYHCGAGLSGINGEIRPGIVHRIDKDTSGLLIVAKNDEAHRILAEQLKDHSLSRIYDAVVCGRVKNDSGTVDVPIGRHPTDRKRQAVNVKNARRAVTHYEVVARYNGYTHIRCKLETGRTHQIRVHMAHIGHPILGDLIYGRKKPEKGLSGQCLNASSLTFRHPKTNELITVSVPLPEYFTGVLQKLGPCE